MLRPVALALIAGLMLVGCGGSTEPEKKAPAPPTVYSAVQIEAALPTIKNMPKAKKISFRCPGSDICKQPEDGKFWSLQFELENNDSAYINVELHSTALAAEQSYDKTSKAFEGFDGPFDIKPDKGDDKSYTPGLKGTGTVKDTRFGAWKGLGTERILSSIGLDGTAGEKFQDAQVEVRQGRVNISTSALIGSPDLTPGTSSNYAREIVEDYIKRLEKS